MPRDLPRRHPLVLEQIIGSALDAFVVIDTDSEVIAWAGRAESLFGWTQDEAIGRNLAELIIPPALQAAHAEGMRRYLATGEPRVLGKRIEIDARHKDGRVFPVELSINVAQVEGTRIFSAALRDISQARQAQQRAERLAAVIESTTDFVGFADPSGAAMYINRAGRALIGLLPTQPLEGVFIRDKYPAWAFEIVQQGIRHALAHGTWSGESGMLTAAGTEIPTSQVITVHLDAAGNVEFISTMIRDMTHRHEVENALRVMGQRKDEFLAMLAHELRNPLAPIASAAQVLSISCDAQRVQRSSQVIARQVAYMSRLLDDLLDVSRVTRGLIKIESAQVDLAAVAKAAVEQAMPVIEARRHRLRVRPTPEPLVVRGDMTRLVQVLVNLLNNASRYTPEGGSIRLDLFAEEAQAVVKVTDNGIGIAPSMRDDIFEVFTQADRSPDRAQAGLGLGLALVRSIVELHGGSVAATSEGPGRGSEFTVRLPRVQVGP